MKYLIIGILFISVQGCKKYLDEKPDKKLILPTSVPAVQSLLDIETTMNLNNPGIGEASADNYYLTDANWAALTSTAQRNMYTWESDITLTEYPNAWSRIYDVVTNANVALESIEKITPSQNEQADWNNAKGSALLYRAKSFLTAVVNWAKAYDSNTAGKDLGIPLRLSADYEIKSTRATVQASYDQVLNDLKQAAELLPNFPKHVMRPSRVAAYGLLARTYLMMRVFDSAAVYSDKYLNISSSLLNYNTLSTSATNPLPIYNVEVAMHSLIPTPSILSSSRARIDSNLYKSYAATDLRKVLFFKNNNNGSFAFKGSYSQSSSLFNGISTDEQYLIKAECQARAGNVAGAMQTLNTLLITRWKTGTFVPFVAADVASAINLILTERRKELLFRDLRWGDLKRLNKENFSQQIIYRFLNGNNYQLQPEDKRYALPIPLSVITLTGMEQNPR